MVDFSKKLDKYKNNKPINPIEIYGMLDRASDKGPLRPAQEDILDNWFKNHKTQRDLIIKLHTGQGKTLIGLLLLQSILNEKSKPVAYLCANNFLVGQTCEQAKQFGIDFCIPDSDLPIKFTNGEAMLITSVHKLFNGLTKFGLGSQYIRLGAVLIDDAHACIDSIRDAFMIKLESSEQAYRDIINLFNDSLSNQGIGTHLEIRNSNYDSFLPVPYWDWQEKHNEVVRILSKYSESNSIKFAWPILKDQIHNCNCIISGSSLEILPYYPPLHLFGSFYDAKHRIFMSASVINDSFLVKGLELLPDTIKNPLVYNKDKWSGEKMIIMPELIDESLNRNNLVKYFGTPKKNLTFGTVVLAPSFKGTLDWESYGAFVATGENIDGEIKKLKQGNFEKSLVIANRYDGIDLPDNMCRILVFDSKPYAVSLIDRYMESCRASSEVIKIKTAKIIEQGLGRSVRGEKDFCVIILLGLNLIKCIQTLDSRRYLSNQTKVQVEIGLKIAEMAKEDLAETRPISVLNSLIKKCLLRDNGWKAFYIEQMDSIGQDTIDNSILDIFQSELEAEQFYNNGEYENARAVIQKIIDNNSFDNSDNGWYLQLMARMIYPLSKTDSNGLQIEAHKKNRSLLKPISGMQISRLKTISQKRMESIAEWIKKFDSFNDLYLSLVEILNSLSFGASSDKFENSLNELAKILGFAGERPDKEWKEGPDNLWGLRDGEFLLIECKNQVALTRSEINKYEADQMNSSCAWFEKYYSSSKSYNLMIIPTKKLASSAAFRYEVKIMTPNKLDKFIKNIKSFFLEFSNKDLKNLSERYIQQAINNHHLSIESLITKYSEAIKK